MSTKDHVAVRLDPDTVMRVDALQPFLATQWREATRSDVLRLLLLDGLRHYEKKHREELGAAPKEAGRGANEPAPPARRSRRKSRPSSD